MKEAYFFPTSCWIATPLELELGRNSPSTSVQKHKTREAQYWVPYENQAQSFPEYSFKMKKITFHVNISYITQNNPQV